MTGHLPEVTSLSASRMKWIGIGLICAVFVIGGFFLSQSADDSLIGWFCMAFFGLGIVISLIQLIKPSTLTLTHDGFEQSAMGRNLNCKWHEVSQFGVVKIQRNKFVSFSRLQDEGEIMSDLSKSVTGGHSGMLGDTFGMKAEELAVLMNQYRDQALSR